jgi:hypothetical protein
MPDQDPSAPTVHDQIANAIRAKREGRSHKLIQDELDAMEASLLADLEKFDPEAIARQVNADEQKARLNSPVNNIDLAFPDIDANAATRTMQKSGIATATAGSRQDQMPQQAGNGLLEQLRHQAEAIQHRQHVEHQQLSRIEAQLDSALRQVFSYLHELIQQLNVLKPPIPRSYPVASSQELHGLVWQQGFTDYRSLPESAGSLIEFVSFNYRLCGTQALEMERDGTVAESFRKFLFDRNLSVKVEEFRNERHYLEKARFTIAPELKVNIRWEADAKNGKLLVHTRNLERLGSACYQLAPDAVNQSLLDEFGRLILDQPQQFTRQANR